MKVEQHSLPYIKNKALLKASLLQLDQGQLSLCILFSEL